MERCAATKFIDRRSEIKLKFTIASWVICSVRSHLQPLEQRFDTPILSLCIPEDAVEPRDVMCADKLEKCVPSVLMGAESSKCLGIIELLQEKSEHLHEASMNCYIP
jgi:hypothetical protein